MREFKKRQPTGSILLKFFAVSMGTLVLFLLTVVVARAAWGMYDTLKIAAEARESAEGQLKSLKSDHMRLVAAVTSFESEEGVEREVRARFGVARPGEGEIQIVRDEASSTQKTGPSENPFFHTLRSLLIW